MDNKLIRKYATSIIKGMIEKINAISELKHELTKGEIREIFVSDLLSSFLTSQFGIGQGIVVNENGVQSDQTDIVIYDNRILPPFIKAENLGVYPAESVIATLEIKSRLRNSDIQKCDKSAELLCQDIYKNISSKPLCGIVGVCFNETSNIEKFLNENIKMLFGVCCINHFCFLRLKKSRGWKGGIYSKETNEETKRFLAVLIDNIRQKSSSRMSSLNEHHDWLTAYIRDMQSPNNE